MQYQAANKRTLFEGYTFLFQVIAWKLRMTGSADACNWKILPSLQTRMSTIQAAAASGAAAGFIGPGILGKEISEEKSLKNL